jgi:adenosylcobinamide-GDP ribazoletransferase
MSRGLGAALGLFTVVPVPARARHPAPGVLVWLPVVGVLLAGPAYLPALAVWCGGGAGSPLLAAALVVTALALLTRGLHLDGTADLADGLGSGRPPEQALEIMRRPDVGAFGAVAVGCTLLVQVAALSAVLAASTRSEGLFALALAAATGRTAVVQAAGDRVAFGSALAVLVAGGVRAPVRWGVIAMLVVAAGFGGDLLGGTRAAVCSVAAVAAGLLVAAAVRRHAVRRLGGVSGDVFGALVEIGTAVVLVVLAAAAAWA